MRIRATDPDGPLYEVFDRESGLQLLNVTWADDETGEYECISVDDRGRVAVNPWGELERKVWRGRIELRKST
jgi:hypothetical protein